MQDNMLFEREKKVTSFIWLLKDNLLLRKIPKKYLNLRMETTSGKFH